MMNSKAFIAMSGGVDSSVAAALMLEQGYDCTGITLKLFAPDSPCLSAQASAQASARAVEDAQAIASRLGIRHYVLDCTEEFEKKVIHRFAEMYEQGITPNPCVICNPNIKFNLELLFAGQSSISRIATGHYARIERDTAGNRFLLRKAVDFKKDQSYVLYGLSQKQLECACFPLGGLTKQQVREYAKERKFFNEKKPESQDICFVTDGDYAGFIEKYTGKTYPPGDIIDTQGKFLGSHRGIIRYTIGQRRGLGVAANIPLYVTEKSAAANTVTLGPETALYSKSVTVKNINLIACGSLKSPTRVKVKIRYLREEQPAIAEQTGEDELRIEFDSPERAITPGQAAVMYDRDIVIGGGTISNSS